MPQVPAGHGRDLAAHPGQPAAPTGPAAGGAGPDRAAGTQKKSREGALQLFFMDEVGFALTLPMTTTWALPGQRPRVRHKHTQGRRIHVLAGQAAPGTTPTTPLIWVFADRSLKSEDLKAFLLQTLPAGTGQPRVVVLDNASTHRHGAMKAPGRHWPRPTSPSSSCLSAIHS